MPTGQVRPLGADVGSIPTPSTKGENMIEILTDPNHWAFEAISEVPLFMLEVFVLDRLFHRYHKGEEH